MSRTGKRVRYLISEESSPREKLNNIDPILDIQSSRRTIISTV